MKGFVLTNPTPWESIYGSFPDGTELCTLALCPCMGLSAHKRAWNWVPWAHRVTCCAHTELRGLSSSWFYGRGNHPCAYDGGRETARRVLLQVLRGCDFVCDCATGSTPQAELGCLSLFYCQSHWLSGRGGTDCVFLQAKLLVPGAARTDILLQATQPLLLARECFCQQGVLCV